VLFVCWLHAISPSFFLLLSDDSIDVQVSGLEDDGVVAAIELLLPLDLHAGSLLLLVIFILWDRLLQDVL